MLTLETGPQDMSSAISLNYPPFSFKCLGTSFLGLTLAVYTENERGQLWHLGTGRAAFNVEAPTN